MEDVESTLIEKFDAAQRRQLDKLRNLELKAAKERTTRAAAAAVRLSDSSGKRKRVTSPKKERQREAGNGVDHPRNVKDVHSKDDLLADIEDEEEPIVSSVPKRRKIRKQPQRVSSSASSMLLTKIDPQLKLRKSMKKKPDVVNRSLLSCNNCRAMGRKCDRVLQICKHCKADSKICIYPAQDGEVIDRRRLSRRGKEEPTRSNAIMGDNRAVIQRQIGTVMIDDLKEVVNLAAKTNPNASMPRIPKKAKPPSLPQEMSQEHPNDHQMASATSNFDDDDWDIGPSSSTLPSETVNKRPQPSHQTTFNDDDDWDIGPPAAPITHQPQTTQHPAPVSGYNDDDDDWDLSVSATNQSSQPRIPSTHSHSSNANSNYDDDDDDWDIGPPKLAQNVQPCIYQQSSSINRSESPPSSYPSHQSNFSTESLGLPHITPYDIGHRTATSSDTFPPSHTPSQQGPIIGSYYSFERDPRRKPLPRYQQLDSPSPSICHSSTRHHSSSYENIRNDADWCVKLVGLDYRATEEDVRRFFDGLDILDNGVLNCRGNGFVQFSNAADMERSFERNKQYIGRRYVIIKRATKQEMEEARTTSSNQLPYRRRPASASAPGSSQRTSNHWPQNTSRMESVTISSSAPVSSANTAPIGAAVGQDILDDEDDWDIRPMSNNTVVSTKSTTVLQHTATHSERVESAQQHTSRPTQQDHGWQPPSNSGISSQRYGRRSAGDVEKATEDAHSWAMDLIMKSQQQSPAPPRINSQHNTKYNRNGWEQRPSDVEHMQDTSHSAIPPPSSQHKHEEEQQFPLFPFLSSVASAVYMPDSSSDKQDNSNS